MATSRPKMSSDRERVNRNIIPGDWLLPQGVFWCDLKNAAATLRSATCNVWPTFRSARGVITGRLANPLQIHHHVAGISMWWRFIPRRKGSGLN